MGWGQSNQMTVYALEKVREINQKAISEGKDPTNKKVIANYMNSDPDFKAAYRYLASKFLTEEGKMPTWERVGIGTMILPQIFGSIETVPTFEGQPLSPGLLAQNLRAELQTMPEGARKYLSEIDNMLEAIRPRE
jgi:hypothetical protein